MNICTIIAKNYVSHARVLAESFRAHHPDGEVAVLVVDDFEGFIDPAEEPFEVLGLDQIGLDDPEQMAASYDVTELSTAVKPWLLRELLSRDGVEAITYLDPDIWIADSIAAVDRLARERGIVLTPHFTEPLPRDGLKPSEEDILIAGAYNLGFISLGRGESGERLTEWWSERLARDCLIEPEKGRFVDQRWIDLVPGIWPETEILRDTAYNIAYWNLPTRRFETDGDGYLVDGKPLRFFHFSGFDPRTPRSLSKHQNRIEVGAGEALTRACAEYAERLLDHGFEDACGWEYGWDRLPNGVRLDGPARRLYREGTASGSVKGSPFERRGAKCFVEHLNQRPGGRGATRYARALRDSRLDLRTAFPDVEGPDAARFEDWMARTADELKISSRLLPAQASRPERAAPAAAERRGVNLAGYLSSELGVGEAARQMLSALSAAGLGTAAIDVPVEAAEMPARLGSIEEADLPFDFNLLCVNADMLPTLAGASSEALFNGRRSAGLWFWEVERFPERWHDSFGHVDEVWVASEFVAESLRPVSPVPVTTVRIPVTPAAPGSFEREELGLPEGFCFLFVFDYRSVFRRKNPLGVVEAFRKAFPPGSGASLAIKTVGAEAAPEEAAALAEAVRDRDEIRLIDGRVSAEAKNAMIAACDCYVSLHRSEGLGLTMAEAMYFGKPVIATAYSGNLDFMTEENSYLVDFELRPVGAGSGPYPEAGRWAAPDIEQAAERMREVFEDREGAAERGAKGAETIRASHSPLAAGEHVSAHLTEIRRERALARLDAPARRGAGRFRQALKRLYMRMLRPYASHERRIDLSTRQSIDELSTEIASLERRAERATEEAVAELRRDRKTDAEAAKRDREALGEETRRSIADLERETAAELEAVDEIRGALGDARTALTSLRESVGDAAADAAAARAAGEQLGEQVLQALRLAGAAGTRMTDLQRESGEQRARLSEETKELSQKLEQLSGHHQAVLADTHGAINELRRIVRERDESAAAEPYMAENRFPEHQHPKLGRVIGFSSLGEGAGEDAYLDFEDLFRGPEALVRDRQRPYVELLDGREPVLDAGCGRGEFIELLREEGLEARGVDLDPGMVARCRAKGLDEVEEADLLETLEDAADGSLGAIFCAQVLEHLGPAEIRRFLSLAASRLRPGGMLIAETVNPHAARALKTFWVDPTHRQPLFPETLLALTGAAGFAAADAFCPLGEGDWQSDRLEQGEYAIVATTAPGS